VSAWIAGVTDVGCALFLFASLAACLKFREADPAKNPGWRSRSVPFWRTSSGDGAYLPLALLILELSDRRESAAAEDKDRVVAFYVVFLGST
jgi:hypothetical protein